MLSSNLNTDVAKYVKWSDEKLFVSMFCLPEYQLLSFVQKYFEYIAHLFFLKSYHQSEKNPLRLGHEWSRVIFSTDSLFEFDWPVKDYPKEILVSHCHKELLLNLNITKEFYQIQSETFLCIKNLLSDNIYIQSFEF